MNKEFALTRTVEAWCCGIAADDELGNTDVKIYASEEDCLKANVCSRKEPQHCAPRKLTIMFGTNWLTVEQLEARDDK